jgi:hypothetical protein
VAKTTVKKLLRCGFRRTGKMMGQVCQCWWRTCREITVFSSSDYHMFYISYPFVTYLLTLPLIIASCCHNGINISDFSVLSS